MICDTETAKGSNIIVMPDVHLGKNDPIGLAMTVKDTVILELLGIDIGCGTRMISIGKVQKDFQKIDSVCLQVLCTKQYHANVWRSC